MSFAKYSDNNCHDDKCIENEFSQIYPDKMASIKIWQTYPVICTLLLGIPFGLFLGWPSTTYPYLLRNDSEIPITLANSAMIAGFLMIGVSISTIFSSRYHFGPKHGAILGCIMMIIGSIILWQARNIFWLLASRLVVGLGSGYATGQVKKYIKEICEPHRVPFFTKQIHLYVLFGVTVAFSIGTVMNFREFPLVPIAINVIILIPLCFIPTTPKDLIMRNKLDHAVVLLNHLRGKRDHGLEINRIEEDLSKTKQNQFLKLINDGKLRTRLILLSFLVFFQQFIGLPATVIYSQIMFDMSGCPYPQYCAIGYALIILSSNSIGTFRWSKKYRKHFLVFSSTTSCILLIVQIIMIYNDVNKFFPYASFVTMSAFVIFYNLGLGTLPITLVPDMFPTEFRGVVSNVYVIQFSIYALLVTKTFQVLMENYEFYVPFCLFLIIGLFNVIFVIVFVPYKFDAVGRTTKKKISLATYR